MKPGISLELGLILFFCFLLHSSHCYRGYREACGTHLHARSRDTVVPSRQCDGTKGLTCTNGVCNCSSFRESRPFWNRTHCVVKLNATCRVHKSYGPELSFLPNLTVNEELFCGKGALCTEEEGCICEEGLSPDKQKVNCVDEDSESGASGLSHNSAYLQFYASMLVILMISKS